MITNEQKQLIQRIVNVWETGKPEGDYSAVSIMDDGPNGIKQISYGRSQTTEWGNLHELIDRYIKAGGKYKENAKIYLSAIGITSLVNTQGFINFLKEAGKDPVMKQCQDEFFDEVYWQPAEKWFIKNNFWFPLSMLVIYDSFIHSGGILDFLRKRFSEKPPVDYGDERTWIESYMIIRNVWLCDHKNKLLKASSYRTKDMLREIVRGNWQLTQLPFVANGVEVI